MIAVEHRLAAGDVGDGVDPALALEALLDLHAGLEPFAVALERLDSQQRRVVVAVRLLRLDLQAHFVARALALERLFEGFEQSAVAAVQIGERRLGRIEQHTLGVVHLDLQGYDGVAAYRNAARRAARGGTARSGHTRRRFTMSKTSAARPRGFTSYVAWRMTPFLSMTKAERTRHSWRTPSVSFSWITPYLRHTSPSGSESSAIVTPLRSRKSACVRQSSRDTPMTTQSCFTNCSS